MKQNAQFEVFIPLISFYFHYFKVDVKSQLMSSLNHF